MLTQHHSHQHNHQTKSTRAQSKSRILSFQHACIRTLQTHTSNTYIRQLKISSPDPGRTSRRENARATADVDFRLATASSQSKRADCSQLPALISASSAVQRRVGRGDGGAVFPCLVSSHVISLAFANGGIRLVGADLGCRAGSD